MIYRRESPSTPSRRFKSIILNPIGIKIVNKCFYKNHQKLTGKYDGTKVCLRRKKTMYTTKFNVWRGVYQCKPGIVSEISLGRRYRTFVGLIKYSNGAINCLPLFSGAYLNQIIQTWSYALSPKIYLFTRFRTGATVPIAYLPLMTCFFNIVLAFAKFSWFCRASGTFCILIRLNLEKGYCIIKIPSNKHRVVQESAFVTLGRNSNILPKGIWIGKAGANILKGFKPVVRGVAKNPVDHPHGGRTKTNSPERTPWGKVAKYNK
jgi:ribosomal protein L2